MRIARNALWLTIGLSLGYICWAEAAHAQSHTVITTDQQFTTATGHSLTGTYQCSGAGTIDDCAITDATISGATVSDPNVTNLSPCVGGSALGVDASNNMCTNPTSTGTITGGSTTIGSCTASTVLFNDAGVLGCDTDFKWDKTSNLMTFGADAQILGSTGSGASAGTFVYIQAGQGGPTAGTGGIAYLVSGPGGAGGLGGTLNIAAGAGGVAGTGGSGGPIVINAGNGANNNGGGGSVSVVGGTGAGSGNGGSVSLNGGSTGSGTIGNINLGTTRGQTTVGNLGIEWTESDTNPVCAAGNYNIFADLSETKFKKCTNGVATDLDTVSSGFIAYGNNGTSDATTYLGIRGGSNTEAIIAWPSPFTGTASTLYCSAEAAPGAGKSWAMTVRVAGADSALTCTIAESATTCNDTTHSFAVTAGNLMSIKSVESGATGDGAMNCAYKIVP